MTPHADPVDFESATVERSAGHASIQVSQTYDSPVDVPSVLTSAPQVALACGWRWDGEGWHCPVCLGTAATLTTTPDLRRGP